MSKHMTQASQKVEKAVGVFANAVQEVESAQKILSEGIKQDSMKITMLKNKITSIQESIEKVEAHRQAKGDQMKANEDLLASLMQFTK
ncbi:hypothetical protein [Bacillus sp. NPDC077027]|uniref:hypothetical protein n=1 Tax=Bacillus sp. NPDC077027 TaxID=3390548 RepID=UPI003D091DBB